MKLSKYLSFLIAFSSELALIWEGWAPLWLCEGLVLQLQYWGCRTIGICIKSLMGFLNHFVCHRVDIIHYYSDGKTTIIIISNTPTIYNILKNSFYLLIIYINSIGPMQSVTRYPEALIQHCNAPRVESCI